ncbi:MAG: 2-amino-4-hydroxy-6-hydroxymethyldihydropteridine diphosphokinase [Acidibacter sp.]|jgi:2-amino-4-hydroxy-6-hydroxymethyldihydropteridine diphosphokinase|nr:2-amino-4-hydroxy-6-hydroxymethyldihydropteridine diphosphokinase [Acidibacter sp.]
MSEVYVAAGSNVDPERHLRIAAKEIARVFPGARFSGAYRNAAVGFEGEDFINFVVGFSTELPVEAVVAELQRIEGLCGRTRDAPKWAPRSMDLDILVFGDRVCDLPGLVLPRPDLLKRPYMLGPMAELAPDFLHPTRLSTMAQLWENFDRAAQSMVRVEIGLDSATE